MNWKMKIVIPLFCAGLYGHDQGDDFIKWKQYFRFGAITENNEYGVGTYFRINRSTKYTFKDLIKCLPSDYKVIGDINIKLLVKN